jgi:hypothetical protein
MCDNFSVVLHVIPTFYHFEVEILPHNRQITAQSLPLLPSLPLSRSRTALTITTTITTTITATIAAAAAA